MTNLPTFREPPSYKSFEPCTEQYLSVPMGVDITENVWLSLKSVSEIKKNGEALLSRSYPKLKGEKLNRKWKQFRSFIRQAENYWSIAQKTPQKSSPLLYYYSFMNLVKAFLLIKKEDVSTLNIFHGLSGKENKSWTGDVTNKKLRVMEESGKKNVFPLYYEKTFGLKCFKNITVKNLFSYINAIAYEYVSVFKKPTSNVGMRALVGIQPKGKCWLILIVQKFFNERIFYRAIPEFKKQFEKVQMPQMNTFRNIMFDFKREEWANFAFYQQKQNKMLDMNNGLGVFGLHQVAKKTFGNYVSPSYAFPGYDAYFNKPIIQSNQVYPFNEEMAIYMLMFFLSTLVRYHPDYLDEIFDSEATWLIEAFILNAPIIFLQAITNKILNKCVIYR